jgi:hypothetical protein
VGIPKASVQQAPLHTTTPKLRQRRCTRKERNAAFDSHARSTRWYPVDSSEVAIVVDLQRVTHDEIDLFARQRIHDESGSVWRSKTITNDAIPRFCVACAFDLWFGSERSLQSLSKNILEAVQDVATLGQHTPSFRKRARSELDSHRLVLGGK